MLLKNADQKNELKNKGSTRFFCPDFKLDAVLRNLRPLLKSLGTSFMGISFWYVVLHALTHLLTWSR